MAESVCRSRLSFALGGLFLLAMVMGSGPGLRLVNPDPADPEAIFMVWGMPTIYLWGLAWYGVQLTAIITAYVVLWRDDDDAAPTGTSAQRRQGG